MAIQIKRKTWETYVTKLETISFEKGIVAVGITDYFTIDGYKKLKIFQSQGRLKNLLIFPNIEFRVDKIIYRSRNNTKPKRLNVHVLFSPDVSVLDIEEGFLHDLEFVYENEPFDIGQKRKLKTRNLEEFGRILQEQHEPFQKQTPLEVGFENAVVSIDKVKDALLNGFKGDYLIVLANEDLSLMSWDGQDHGTRKQLLQMAHAVFTSNEGDRNFCLGHVHKSPDH